MMARTPSRPQQWADACSKAISAVEDLAALQVEYQEWQDNLPDGLDQGPLAEKLEGVIGLELKMALETLQEADAIDLPRGFGRD